MRILTCIVMWVQFFPRLSTLRNKNTYKLSASFTPFVLTADGALGHEAKTFIHHLADRIAVIWQKSNSEVLGYVRARMHFAVLRATNLCICGSRVKWRRRMEIEDGAGLPYLPE